MLLVHALQILGLSVGVASFLLGLFAPEFLALHSPDDEAVARLCYVISGTGVVAFVAIRHLRHQLLVNGRPDWALFGRIVWALAFLACISVVIVGSATYDIDGEWLAATTTRKTIFVELPFFFAALLIVVMLPRVLWINIIVFVALWAAAEIGFELASYFLIDEQKRELIERRSDNNGNSSTRFRKRIGKDIVYDVVYTTDQYGRRATPIHTEQEVDRFAIFFGGSFTFGEGVDDDETLPYYFAQLSPGYRPYNYGKDGRGPSDMLELLQTRPLAREIDERRGVAIFLFIDDHVRRVVGSLTFWIWGRDRPQFILADDGEIVSVGTFLDASSPAKRFLYSLLNRSNVLRSLNFDIPVFYGKEEYDLIAKVIAKSRELLQDQFEEVDFYLAVYPGPRGRRLIDAVENQSIEVIDLAGIIDRTDGRFRLHELDGHPTPLAHKAAAQAIVSALRNDGPDR